ncbi:glutathione S-transferase family protein [Xanthobacter pseudotagetidis]|uniref:glutathione S-transferase family protein n=1 Tax=Xanthobacter pseudotagetidis TaxID=3119911 RepID=UPI00372B756E
MKLYWAPHSRAFRVLWMLEEAGVAYERALVDIRNGAQDTPAFRAVNPMGKVPALTDGEARLAESAAICAYVAERVPEAGLAPALGDPARGRYLQYLFFSAGCMEPAFVQKMMGVSLPKSSAGWGSFDLVMEVVDAALTPGPYLLGEQFTAADVMLGSDVWYGIGLLKVIDPTPAMVAYVERLTARPAFKRAQEIEAAALAAAAG